MTPVTLIMAYYDNPNMLARHYELIGGFSANVRDHLNLIIVDDCSPNYPAMPGPLSGVALQIYRLREDIRWNQDACRNIGVRHSETNWVLLTDMDHMVPEQTWEAIINRKWNSDIAYTLQRVSAPDMTPYKPHPNSWFMHRHLYEKIGGYDERFAGYYGTDGDFKTRVQAAAEIKMIKEKLIRVPRTLVHDASTTGLLRKQPDDRAAIIRIRKERDSSADKAPIRFRFPYDRIYPEGA